MTDTTAATTTTAAAATASSSALLLGRRIDALEKGAVYDATKKEIQRVQMEHLEQLRAIRKAMTGAGGSATTTDAGATSTLVVSSKQVETLEAEKAELIKKVSKQAYRIEHLVNVVDELLKNQK